MPRINDMTRLAISTLIGTLAAAAIGITALSVLDAPLGLTISGLALLAAVGGPLFFYYRGQWSDSYRGRIEFKGTEERATFDANGDFVPLRLPYLVVRLAEGGQKRVYVGNRPWSKWQVGQAIVKRAGRLNPELARETPTTASPPEGSGTASAVADHRTDVPRSTQARAIPQATGNKNL